MPLSSAKKSASVPIFWLDFLLHKKSTQSSSPHPCGRVAVRARPVRKPKKPLARHSGQRDTATPLENAGLESELRKSFFFGAERRKNFF
jgi:hypothetical protein